MSWTVMNMFGRSSGILAMGTSLSGSSMALAIAGVLVLSGCASGGDGPEKPVVETPVPAKVDLGIAINYPEWSDLGYQLDWIGYPFPRAGRPPVVKHFDAYDDIVVLQESDTTLTVLEASTGKRRWGSELAGPLTRFLGISRDPLDASRLFVISESESFVLSVPNGNLLARQRFERVVNTTPLVVGEIAAFGTSSGELYAHNMAFDSRAWGFVSDSSFEGALVAIGDTIGGVSQSGDVLIMSPNGKMAGRHRIYGGVATNPVANSTMMFIAGLDQSLWGFEAFGNNSWRYRTSTPLRSQPTATEDRVYCEVPGEGLVAFESESGTVLWKAKDVRGTVVASRNNKLVVWNPGEIFLLDPERGDVLQNIKTPGIVKLESQSFADGALFAISAQGAVAKMTPKK